jgi:uncharacterized protein YjbI with pentapeptide repeats
MADEEHLKIIRQGVDAWNEWRQKNHELIPDLSEADLSEVKLNGANLSGANLCKANLSGADLTKADLSDSKPEC